MPAITLRDLTAGEAETTVTYNGHTIRLTYDPGAVTDKTLRTVAQLVQQAQAVDGLTFAQQMNQAARQAAAQAASQATSGSDSISGVSEGVVGEALASALSLADLINALLARFLIRWELLDNDGVNMYPITPERLGELPLDFRQACLQALFGTLRLGESNGMTSKAPSRATTSGQRRAGSGR